MKRGTFFAFVGPSLVMMLIFIAAPLVSVFVQSFETTRVIYREEATERCTPGFPNPVCERDVRLVPVNGPDGRPLTETVNVGFDNYRALLKPTEIAERARAGMSWIEAALTVEFWRALRFTLSFTFVTLPLVVLTGLALALALDATVKSIRGPIIFVTLLPFIITPIIGALSIRWLFQGDGILTAAIQAMSGTRVSLLSQGWTLEALMIFYRVWHVAPFAFIIFYAGLQTVNRDTVESAIVDGASRLERLRYVIVPHLMPLIVFVSLIHLMDSYRVFEEVVGFASQAHVISLQWLTFDLLTPDNTGNRAVGRASASSMLTMIGIVILLVPLILRTWRDQRGR